jgi:uncharacterized protein YeaO (DUF488 family)
VILLYAARDEHKNKAVALGMWLDQQSNEGGRPQV